MIMKFLLDCPEVHRILDYVEVIVDPKFFGIDRIMKHIASLGFPTNSEDS